MKESQRRRLGKSNTEICRVIQSYSHRLNLTDHDCASKVCLSVSQYSRVMAQERLWYAAELVILAEYLRIPPAEIWPKPPKPYEEPDPKFVPLPAEWLKETSALQYRPISDVPEFRYRKRAKRPRKGRPQAANADGFGKPDATDQ